MAPKDSIVFTKVVPVLGGFVALAMFGSPIRAVWAARKRNNVGVLNLLPFVFTVANCLSWVAYSFVIDNWYLFIPNFLGFLIGLMLFLVAYGIGVSDALARNRIIIVSMVLAVILPVVAAIERLVLNSHEAQKQLWGYTANSILFCYYLSPLATLALVLKTRSSASLTLPLCVMNIVNGSLWMTYGLVLSDPFVWVPNAIGAVLGVIQTSLCLAFPSQLIPTDAEASAGPSLLTS